MTDEAIGTRMGDYEILGVLGAGGMGKVYKVRNVLSGRVEAMKVLLPDLSDQAALGERFLKEIKILANLNHPNIAALRTALTIDNQLVMIMEYVEGTTLAARLQQGPIPIPDALRYVDQVLAALSYAHQQHVIHRDIKPANMMLTPDGTVKLMDFGIARSGEDRGLTMTGTTLGSVAYMSPEQVKCGTIDARSDLYSVGVSLYEMVSGKKPFEGENNFAVMKAHLEDAPQPPAEIRPEVSEPLSKLILMAMAKDPAQRFQTADAFRAALRSVAPNLQAAAFVAAPAAAMPVSPKLPPSTATIPMTAAQGSHAGAQSAARADSAAQIPAAAAAKSHRGMYITLGAAIVVIVLIAAGLAVPRWERTRANSGAFFPSRNSANAPASGSGTQAADSPASSAAPAAENPAAAATPGAPVQNSSSAADTAASRASEAANAAKVAAQSAANQAAAQAAAQAAEQTAAQAAAAEQAAQLEELSHEMDQLSSRAAAAGAGLNDLQRQQSAQGLGLRGDMVEAGQLMGTYMSRAQAALQDKDPKGARKYMDLADAQISKVEKFLGR